MSKNDNQDISEFDPLNREFTEAEKQQQMQQEQEFFSQSILDIVDDGFIVASSSQSTPSISVLSNSLPHGDQKSDPITEAIRKEILEKQRDILREYLANTNPELAAQIAKEEDDKKFRAFLSNQDNYALINKAFEDPETKKNLEEVEIVGYRNILSTYSAASGYPGGFQPVQWENQVSASDLRSTVVKNDAGEELCTLNETTIKTNSLIVAKQDGTQVQINSYREIDFPIKLDKADGSMHLSMVALKADGTKPAKDKAVYFTAHYEEGPNGKPQLKEISSPQPLKFVGTGDDAVAYIEHGGEIYTLAVTRGKYKAMMKEVALNNGQSVDLSQTIAEDLTKVQGPSHVRHTPIITPNQELELSIETHSNQQVPPITTFNKPLQPEISQTHQLQPQQAQSSGIPNLVLNAAHALSISMQDLLHNINASLTQKQDINKQSDLIKEAANTILNNKKSDFAEKQYNIIALTENTLSNKDIIADAKVNVVSALLETIQNDQNTLDIQKSKILEATVAITLNSENIELKQKQQILEKVVDVSLSIKDDISRAVAIDSITDAVIKSNIANKDKEQIFMTIFDQVNSYEFSNITKQKLLGSMLKKAVETKVISPEQQQLIHQNLDKITTEHTKRDTIEKVNNILLDPFSNTVLKTTNIQVITANVLDSPVPVEIKSELIQVVTQKVAESALEPKDKTEIVKGIGKIIATHSDTSLPLYDKGVIMESVAKGIVESKTDLRERELITEGLVNGIYEVKGDKAVVHAISSVIANSNINQSEKEVLKKSQDIVSERVLDKEIQNLDGELKEKNIEESKLRDDIYNKTQDVANELNIKTFLDDNHGKREVSEEVPKNTSSLLNDISQRTIEKVNNLRAMLSQDANLKTFEEKKDESTKKVDELVKAFDNKSSTEEQQNFIKSHLIDNKTLSREVRLQIIDNLLKAQAQKRAETIENLSAKTEDVRVVSGKSELEPISKDEPYIQKAKMVVERDRVGIKDNIKIMGALINARDSIQSENLNKSTHIKKESSVPQR
ncbi:Sca4 family spreading effector [Rickettsia typhi]|uniref:Antigenic heat-stable 120 kDa protein n=2 Tax=Rickettsia typhi TaxID=785 RepID=SCA4_RICTY|nr:Sca4 family spreading effector [Rickettsia typhi]Q9AJ63.2 RecName: Full=Antigenic heat-stable 120 kDa protein; AltName: Full=120 kDa antigen; AltName: Full=Protein PS 120; Short=PS120 [Rickettsia typhi str. Wilmington]AAU03957.1 cell surface antigen [Rickettsia typhi str. Wilmington]AFE54338.1 cell surface antigen [Rickettsia typhi str. TH1527]AFE55177.1 cell surface antigen [Rickettsia typhi str. B9991CWPP]